MYNPIYNQLYLVNGHNCINSVKKKSGPFRVKHLTARNGAWHPHLRFGFRRGASGTGESAWWSAWWSDGGGIQSLHRGFFFF